MMTCARIVLLIVSAFAGNGFVYAPAVPLVDASLTQTTAAAKNANVQTVSFQSQLVGKTLPYNVVLPVDYNQPDARATRYPVLYLLHGLTGHYDNWTTRTRVGEYAAAYEIIIVTPEGNDGWYTDSQMAPAEKYETYIIKELIPDVDRRFRTVNKREGRAIAGLSMGGYGALKFGVKYPAMFAFAGSMSGAPNVASWTHEELKSFAFIWRSLHPVFGDEGSPTRVANDVPKLYRELSPEQIAVLPYIYLDCGTEDPLFPANRSFAEILVTRRIPHEYRQLPGRHSWQYWDAQVHEVLKVAVKKMRTL
jgi:putative tributyrin esterase